LLLVLAVGYASLHGVPASAGVLFESATLGATGVPSDLIVGGEQVPGNNVFPTISVGVRFLLPQQSRVTGIASHIVELATNPGGDL